MRNKKATFTNLDEMISCHEYDIFRESKLGNDLWINDPNRAERIHEAVESGSDGSTHYEIIKDWREFLDSYKCEDPEFHEDSSEWEIDLAVYDAIMKEINKCEEWHEKNGSLHNQLS